MSGLATYRDTSPRDNQSECSFSDGEDDSVILETPQPSGNLHPDDIKTRIAAFANRFAEGNDRMRTLASAQSTVTHASIGARRSAYASGEHRAIYMCITQICRWL